MFVCEMRVGQLDTIAPVILEPWAPVALNSQGLTAVSTISPGMKNAVSDGYRQFHMCNVRCSDNAAAMLYFEIRMGASIGPSSFKINDFRGGLTDTSVQRYSLRLRSTISLTDTKYVGHRLTVWYLVLHFVDHFTFCRRFIIFDIE